MDVQWIAHGIVCAGLCLWVSVPALGQNENVTVNEQPTAEQRLAEVNELRKAGRYDAAAELVQELIEQSQLKLVGIGAGRYTDAERWCREELLRDAALREAYRQRYSALATRSLEQALLAEEPIAALDETVRQYLVTEPALEAGLQLAGRLLEAGEAASASALMDELGRHPDKDQQLARVLMLQGASAVYTRDTESMDDAVDRLKGLGQPDRAAWITALNDALGPGALADQPGQLDAGIKPSELRQSLWDQPLAEADRAAIWLRNDLVLPVVTPSLAMVNNGRQIVALDRASGQRLWVYPSEEAPEVVRMIGGERWYDARGVALQGGSVCAVLGESFAIVDGRDPDVVPNRLVCVDEQTGQARWERRAGDLKDNEPLRSEDRKLGRANLALSHFVGTPIIAQGKVFTLLRRANAQHSSQTIWLIAYDLRDGTMLWFRHLSLTSMSYNDGSKRLTPQILLHGETLYITDNIATVGAIDTRSGGYHWLRVLPVTISRTRRPSVDTQGMVMPPVLTHAGLLVPLALESDRLILLDPADGSTLQDFKNDPHLSGAQYVMGTGDGAIVVSQNSVAFWDDRQAKVVWSLAMDANEKAQGIGDVTRRFVIVPTTLRLIVIDRLTGKVLDRVDQPGGNLTVRDGEVLAVRDGRLYSYTSWERAYERLVDRVKQEPSDPSPGLALASLAMRLGGRQEAMMQGVGFALDAIALQTPAQAEVTRQRVIDQLRDLVAVPDLMDDPTRRLLYDRLALATLTAAQEVAYHLDVGRYYAAMGQADLAVEHFQAVVSDPAFASQSYRSGSTTRSAGAVAQEEILKLIEQHGRSVYARYDALAQARLAELKATGQGDASALALIARRYPMSLAAVDALLQAGQAYEKQGDPIAATALYQQAVVRSGHAQQRQAAVGSLLLYYLSTNRPDAASQLLDREARLHPDLYPVDGGKPVSPAVWRERIAQVKAVADAPADLAAQLDTPYLLPGRLVMPAIDRAGAGLSAGRHMLLHHDDGTLTCHGGDRPGQALWTAALPAGARQWLLVAQGQRQFLLWSPDAGVVVALDESSGDTLWQTPLSLGAEPFAAEQLPGGERERMRLAVSDTVVCFGRTSDAKLVVIDRAGGGVLWRSRLSMSELTAIDCDQWTLAVAGRIGQIEQNSEGRLALLNLFTGEALTETPELKLTLSPMTMRLDHGRAILCGSNKIAAVDIVSGGEMWSYVDLNARFTGEMAISGNLLALASEGGSVLVIDHRHGGTQLGSVVVRGETDMRTAQVHAAGGSLWVTAGRGLFCLGQSPVVKWSDAVSLPYKQPVCGLIGRDRVALIAVTDALQDADRIDQPKSFGLFILDRAGGRLINQYTLGPVADEKLQGLLNPAEAQLIGRGLAVPIGWQTLVVPGKPAP